MSTTSIDEVFEIYLNSKYDRLSTDSSSDWTTEFQNITLSNSSQYGIALQSCQIPNVAPQFHETETNFIISDDIGDNSYTYDNTKIFNTVESLLSYVTTLVGLEGVVFSQDNATKLCKVSNNSGEEITLNFGNTSSNNFFTKLGFESTIDITLTNTEEILSTAYPSLLSTSRFYIVCEEISNNSFSGRQYNSWSIFKSVNCNASFGSFCNFENTNDNNLYFHDLMATGNINNLSFKILDDRMRVVDLKDAGVKLSIYLKKY